VETFYVNGGGEPEYLDPGKCADGACAALITQLFEGLTRYHPEDARPAQGVAVAWEKSDDNRLFRFHLRPDARWSDGRPVTASDFEYAWRRALRPATASRAAGNLQILKNGEWFRLGKVLSLPAGGDLLAEPRAGAAKGAHLPERAAVRVIERQGGFACVERWLDLPTYARSTAPPAPGPRGWVRADALVADDSVVGVRAEGDLTLLVELDHPAPYFLDLTSHHAFSPVRRDVIEPFEQRGEGDRWTVPGAMISNGAYALDRWAFRYQITLAQNPYYWDRARLKIRRIAWMEVEDQHATMNLYKAGELDYLGDNLSPPAEYVPLLAGKRDSVRHDYLSVYWYELNTKKPPLDDARVRRALDLAIDKRQIVERITRGGQRPAEHYVPDFTGGGYAEQVAADPFQGGGFNPEEARALLAEAGFPGGRGFPEIEVLYNSGEGHRLIAVAVQAMWREHLGITVRLRSEEWKVMLKTYRDGDFQVMRYGQTADYNHPATFLETFLGNSPQNRTGFRDAAFDETMARAARAGDAGESVRLYREAERRALEAMPRIPLYFNARATLVKPWVKGFRGNARNPHAIQYLWVDPEWQRDTPDTTAYTPADMPPPGRF
jgi:oligopeptide transport system substrate-binding protein